MFLDGVTYASIARNLAEGRGRFWALHYTETIYPAFHEHPPLGFWLQSLWFRIFGDQWFVERAYSAAAAALVGVFIVITWRAARAVPGARDQDWLPVALWMAAPVVSWTIVGNLLETTVAVFVIAAVAVLIAGQPVREDRRTRVPSWDFAASGSVAAALGRGCSSGLCIVAATLSKGPVGLFPLAAPFALGLLPERRGRWMWAGSAGQWTILGVCG